MQDLPTVSRRTLANRIAVTARRTTRPQRGPIAGGASGIAAALEVYCTVSGAPGCGVCPQL